MSTFLPTPALLPVLAIGALFLSACDGINIRSLDAEDGSGVPETTSFDFDDFSEIEVGGVFDVTVTVADGPPTVEVTVDDNFVDDLDVRVSGDRLRIGFDGGNYDPDVQPTAVVTVESLEEIEVSGASAMTVTDVDSERLSVEASGASEVVISGETTTLSVEASGASDADFSQLTTSTATVEASGASDVEIGAADRVDGDLSGASTLVAPAGAAGSIDTSGASNVKRN